MAAGSINSQLLNNYNSLTTQNEPTTNRIGGSPRWYLLTAATNATLEIDTEGSNVRTMMEVYTNFLNSPFWSTVASDVASAPDGQSLVRFSAVSNAPYLIEVGGDDGVQGNSIYMNWRMGILPNTASSVQILALTNGQPLLLIAGENANVTEPIAYQWQLNGTNIPGATLSDFQLPGILFNQCGDYSVVVSNLMGAVTNAIALVTVDSALKIELDSPTQPASARLSGSAPEATVLLLSTNLASSLWSLLSTNPPPLLPVSYLDTNSAGRRQGLYRLEPWPWIGPGFRLSISALQFRRKT
ncbi:MAG TPA: hypothetical protein VMA35_09145 [Candidatus Sulfopaludibacter sp.]|nr:hypothetical protein [Candidatus Sulfopaludibacter sp.]